MLHALREEMQYSVIVDSCLKCPDKPDLRDLTAIKRICTGFVKLIFPHAERKADILSEEFIKHCLEPAFEMRRSIKTNCVLSTQKNLMFWKREIFKILLNVH